MKLVKVEEQLLDLHLPLQRPLKWFWLWIPDAEKVSLLVYTSYCTEENRTAFLALEASSEVKIFDNVSQRSLC